MQIWNSLWYTVSTLKCFWARVVVGSISGGSCSVHMGFKFPALAVPYPLLCPWTVVGKWLCDSVYQEAVSVALVCTPLWLFGASHLGMCRPDGLAGTTDHTWIWTRHSAFFLIVHGPADLSLACCYTPCVLDGLNVFTLLISLKKELPLLSL